MTHNFTGVYCQVSPPLERVVADSQRVAKDLEVGQFFELWPTQLMVCRRCFEVQLHSTNPNKGAREVADTGLIITIVNPGNGSEYCHEEAQQ